MSLRISRVVNEAASDMRSAILLLAEIGVKVGAGYVSLKDCFKSNPLSKLHMYFVHRPGLGSLSSARGVHRGMNSCKEHTPDPTKDIPPSCRSPALASYILYKVAQLRLQVLARKRRTSPFNIPHKEDGYKKMSQQKTNMSTFSPL